MRVATTILAGAGVVSAWSELLHQPIFNKNVDAIVQPGAYTSHMHTFFGSDIITNVMPTTEELQQGCYSGVNPNDLSVYWIPTLYHVDGDTFTEVPVFTFGTYYTAAYSEIPIPPNFAVIAGNASAQTQEQANHPANMLEWYCENSDDREPEIARMPTKTCDQHLRFSLLFPNCVNPDDVSQYDYHDSATNKCPDGMKRMPQLRISSRYDTKKVAPKGWDGVAPFQLSCSQTPGEGFCFHGDFINGWFDDAAEGMLVGDGNGRDDGRFITGARGSSATPATCTPVDHDPENGTSDYWESLEMMAGAAAAPAPALEAISSAPTFASATSADVSTAPQHVSSTDAAGSLGAVSFPASATISVVPESTSVEEIQPSLVSVTIAAVVSAPASNQTASGRKYRNSAKFRQGRIRGSDC